MCISYKKIVGVCAVTLGLLFAQASMAAAADIVRLTVGQDAKVIAYTKGGVNYKLDGFVCTKMGAVKNGSQECLTAKKFKVDGSVSKAIGCNELLGCYGE